MRKNINIIKTFTLRHKQVKFSKKFKSKKPPSTFEIRIFSFETQKRLKICASARQVEVLGSQVEKIDGCLKKKRLYYATHPLNVRPRFSPHRRMEWFWYFTVSNFFFLRTRKKMQSRWDYWEAVPSPTLH